MIDRTALIGYLRGEIVGPSLTIRAATTVEVRDGRFQGVADRDQGPLSCRFPDEDELQEILYYDRETPHRKYGAGILWSEHTPSVPTDEVAANATDTLGVDTPTEDPVPGGESGDSSDEPPATESATGVDSSAADDFEVTSVDVRHPSTMGISFCARLPEGSSIVIAMPRARLFPWQIEGDRPFQVNGRYDQITRVVTTEGVARESPAWRRSPAVVKNAEVEFSLNEIRRITPPPKLIATTLDSLVLSIHLYARQLRSGNDEWLLTVVVRNQSRGGESVASQRATMLYQSYFEIAVRGGALLKYPETQRPFDMLDADEQSMMLLYQEAATWGIGHGCAAGWDTDPRGDPHALYAEVLPAVELPSMTPDVRDATGNIIRLSMRELSELDDTGQSPGWKALSLLVDEYGKWIDRRRADVSELESNLRSVAVRHVEECESCLRRIRRGVEILAADSKARTAFCLSNMTMLLQQIATKRIPKAAMRWDPALRSIAREDALKSPWSVYVEKSEGDRLGYWRAFQAAFLLMQIESSAQESSPDRAVIDLIWFPTGGGKTEAYLGAMAFYMFHERLLMSPGEAPSRDGTNVLMRYTLRMLTTQQFQRAASMICAMEHLRRKGGKSGLPAIPGRRFSLGLWVGGGGSPNKIAEARQAVNRYKEGKESGNPLVLTDCPWCRASIGLVDGPKGSRKVLAGVMEVDKNDGPRLLCPDARCEFGGSDPETWLPVEVIDERIYPQRPSLVIATADKFAMLAYRNQARALFGLGLSGGQITRISTPPGLIVQDELHLIAGPLGTMYALYEGVIERLCCKGDGEDVVRPKIIASTATIRGAEEQTRGLYARLDAAGRSEVRLFPAPGLRMGDSFFGVYARDAEGRLQSGRLYLGIHANEYGSVLTAQVRAFAAVICRAGQLEPDRRDPWWTLLSFYNSIRELGGAKTLFDSDIRSRLKYLQSRENIPKADRRRLQITEELTSRLSQAEIVGMMDRLALPFSDGQARTLDACLASNIIEVGVDIDRLSLMGVVGQPKTTAQYIQVTGRVGRRWEDRPGLILMLYSPGKSRDRSHFEQFFSYHRRLYERVEPASVTPFAISAIQRGLNGALIAYARSFSDADPADFDSYRTQLDAAFEILSARCRAVQRAEDVERSLAELEMVRRTLYAKWRMNPQKFEEFPPSRDGEYLMLWPGQYSTMVQQQRGVVVPSSMRQVDGSGELVISPAYSLPE